jgi:hypothetical protein
MPSIHIWSYFAHQFHRNIFNIGLLILYTLLGKDSMCIYVNVILFLELVMQIFTYVIDTAGVMPKKTSYLGSLPSTAGMGQRG